MRHAPQNNSCLPRTVFLILLYLIFVHNAFRSMGSPPLSVYCPQKRQSHNLNAVFSGVPFVDDALFAVHLPGVSSDFVNSPMIDAGTVTSIT